MPHNLSDIFAGIAAKYLTKVDAEPSGSNQHEIGGLVKAGFAEFIGRPDGGEVATLRCRMSYLLDDEDEALFEDDYVSWYDSRHADSSRGPEYRLYYRHNPVTEKISEGDLMVVGYTEKHDLQIIFAAKGTASEAELINLFQLHDLSSTLTKMTVSEVRIGLPMRLVLEDIGIEVGTEFEDSSESKLDMMLKKFGGKFPATKTFSQFARESAGSTDGMSVDDQLLLWMEMEESLFRVYERHIVGEQIDIGFGDADSRVDNFISLSLSVQNRRKSRAGHAFENHLDQIFTNSALVFEKGSSRHTTENNSKPDFLFPGFRQYHDKNFEDGRLTLLGAKTSCKDRWRQVLSEGNRVKNKHLVTLQLGISKNQISEMKANSLHLVVPQMIRSEYFHTDNSSILSLHEFVQLVKSRVA